MENVDNEKFKLVREGHRLKREISRGLEYAYKMLEAKKYDLKHATGSRVRRLKKDIEKWHRVVWHIENLPKG